MGDGNDDSSSSFGASGGMNSLTGHLRNKNRTPRSNRFDRIQQNDSDYDDESDKIDL